MALTTSVTPKIQTVHTNALDLGTPNDNLDIDTLLKLTSGTGADQADLQWHDQRTISASGTDSLDLAGSLTDAFGATLTFARVKLIYVKAASGNTNDVQIGGGSNAFVNWVAASGDIVVVKPGGVFLLYAPGATAYAVTAGTGDILQLANSAGGTSVTYDIVIIGASA